MPTLRKDVLQSLRSKYPQYGDIDDATLSSKVLSAHPEYHDLVDQSSSQPSFADQHPYLGAAANLATGVGKGAMNTVSNIADGLNWASQKVGGPALTTLEMQAHAHQLATANGTAQSIGKGLEQAGEFLIPGVGEDALAAKMGGKLLPRLAAKAAGSAVVNTAQGGSPVTGALLGAGGEGLASGLRAVAPHVAEAALNVAGRDRMYGRTVGDAILNDTKGVRPSTIQRSATAKIADLAPQVQQLAVDAGNSGARGSLLGARNAVASTVGTHMTNRAVDSAAELSPIASRLSTDAVTGLPLSAAQTPTGLLQLKRGINSDFITRWKPENQGLTKEAQKVYGNLSEEFHNAAPGTAELDQRMSSLFPVADRAGAASNNASITQNVLHKFKTPTGALTGAFAGGTAGYEQSHSLAGAAVGAGLGMLAPAVVSNPATQMILARSIYSPALGRYIFPAATGLGLQATRKDDQ